jgi:hypothetical protein
LVSLCSAIEAAKEPPRQLNREAARIWTLRGMKWACATKLVATAGGGVIANQVEQARHRNLVAQSSVIDQHRFWSNQFGRRLAVEAFPDCLAGVEVTGPHLPGRFFSPRPPPSSGWWRRGRRRGGRARGANWRPDRVGRPRRQAVPRVRRHDACSGTWARRSRTCPR